MKMNQNGDTILTMTYDAWGYEGACRSYQINDGGYLLTEAAETLGSSNWDIYFKT